MNLQSNINATRLKSLVSTIAILFFLPFLLYAVYQAAALISRAAGKPADITVDASVTIGTVDTDFYHAFAQGGEEATDMLAGILPTVRALKPKIIRLDHIYDNYNVVSVSNGQLSFDFSRLDRAVDSIRSTGAVPLLALSYMPPAISRDGSVIGVPRSWNDWSQVVRRTIEHYSGKREKNLTGVYYEVWNEPDLAQFGSWKLSGEKNYLTLYRYAAQGAQSARNTNPFQFGGPATTGLYQNWIMALVGSGYRMDFLSWHSYLEDAGKFRTDQQNIFKWLQKYPQYVMIPKLVTEFGFSGNKDARYGSAYGAVYTALAIRQLMDAHPDYVFTFQLKDGPHETGNSGWGLISHETNGQIKKPRYYIYGFMDSMAGSRLLLKGEGTWVTSFASRSGPTVRVMLINFDKSGYRLENVPVTVSNLTPGSYSVRKKYLYQTGCAINQPKANNQPPVTQIPGGTFATSVCLPAQNVTLIELTKL